MSGIGLSVGGVAGIGVAAGAGLNVPAAAPAASPASFSLGNGLAPSSPDFVVTLSDAAIRALALDVATAVDNSTPSQLADDLAALALLAILERDQQRQDGTAATMAAAVAAYAAMQAMGSG